MAEKRKETLDDRTARIQQEKKVSHAKAEREAFQQMINEQAKGGNG